MFSHSGPCCQGGPPSRMQGNRIMSESPSHIRHPILGARAIPAPHPGPRQPVSPVPDRSVPPPCHSKGAMPLLPFRARRAPPRHSERAKRSRGIWHDSNAALVSSFRPKYGIATNTPGFRHFTLFVAPSSRRLNQRTGQGRPINPFLPVVADS